MKSVCAVSDCILFFFFHLTRKRENPTAGWSEVKTKSPKPKEDDSKPAQPAPQCTAMPAKSNVCYYPTLGSILFFFIDLLRVARHSIDSFLLYLHADF
jgi:hypothetical protein